MATDGDRPPRGGATSAAAAADLFICFTSRSSSSSSSLMKLPSKSLFSPARSGGGVDAGHGPATVSSTSSSSMLYTSLSRRLRHSGSLRGGGQASPMFPPAGSGKKKAAFEEPSSPKVTCIGQVRVKTRKQGKRMRAARSRSRRRSEGGSFRERERQRYWAALPISICEAVRALGAEFNCFQPCGGAQSWCASSASPAAGREKADRKRPARSYCGAVFARWLVTLNEEGEKEVVSHVLPEREEVGKVEEGRLERLGDAAVVVEKEEGHEYEVCVPPKNALLLMRCRSEPFRMASYTNRFWESPANPDIGRGEDGGEEEEEQVEENGNATVYHEVKAEIEEEEEVVEEKDEEVVDVEVKDEDKDAIFVADGSENSGRSSVCVGEEDGEEMKVNEQEEKVELGEVEQASDHESPPPSEAEAPKEDDGATDEQIQEETPSVTEPSSESDEREEQEAREQAEKKTTQLIVEEEAKTTQLTQTQTPEEEEEEEEGEEEDDDDDDTQPVRIESPEMPEPIKEDDEKVEVKAISISESEEAIGAEEEVDMAATAEEKVKEEEDGALPECLLLMLYEPKLSMEVSKETWVCSTDFFQWRPSKDRRPKLAGDAAVASGGVIEGRRNSTDSRPSRPSGNRVAAVSAATAAAATAGRPPPPSMATVVEEKLVKAAAYEPLVLTRCKSEPMRTSARLAPEACFWKSGRKLPQPPRRSLRADPVS